MSSDSTAEMIRALAAAALLVACGGTTPAPPPPDPPPPSQPTAKQELDPLETPAPEVADAPDQVKLPTPPSFELPAVKGDLLSPKLLRVRSKKYLDTKVAVRGTVVWIYDCAAALRTPDMSEKELRRLLRDEPERCSRPHLYLGDSATTPSERSAWVVEVPRPLRRDERITLPQDMIDSWPEVPKVKVGDQVIIRGTWATQSPMGFRSSDGLLVYESLEHVK